MLILALLWIIPTTNTHPQELTQKLEPNYYMVPCQFSNDPTFTTIVEGRYDGKVDVLIFGKTFSYYRGPDGNYKYCRCHKEDLLKFNIRAWKYGNKLVGYTYHVASLDDRLAIIEYKRKRTYAR